MYFVKTKARNMLLFMVIEGEMAALILTEKYNLAVLGLERDNLARHLPLLEK